ncbi:hypothetical protein NDU88_009103 [Pleurodeles waltl]|uniref:Uncharacterized protein n=1 Tax=Pleurodeles waltl TaxID=8319 RepID=A0AAV7RXE8_PLEWA|nr:hypothetical protein NDU88_009103 [Pleurodeles waltl]
MANPPGERSRTPHPKSKQATPKQQETTEGKDTRSKGQPKTPEGQARSRKHPRRGRRPQDPLRKNNEAMLENQPGQPRPPHAPRQWGRTLYKGGTRATKPHPREQDTDPEHPASATWEADREERHQRQQAANPERKTYQTSQYRAGQKEKPEGSRPQLPSPQHQEKEWAKERDRARLQKDKCPKAHQGRTHNTQQKKLGQ